MFGKKKVKDMNPTLTMNPTFEQDQDLEEEDDITVSKVQQNQPMPVNPMSLPVQNYQYPSIPMQQVQYAQQLPMQNIRQQVPPIIPKYNSVIMRSEIDGDSYVYVIQSKQYLNLGNCVITQ